MSKREPWITALAAQLDAVAWSEHSVQEFERLIRKAIAEQRKRLAEQRQPY